MITRRTWLKASAAASVGLGWSSISAAAPPNQQPAPLKITNVRITPIALPDPPLLAASGCHGPYFLRNIIEIETDANITGIGETKGGLRRTTALEKAARRMIGQNAFSYRAMAPQLLKFGTDIYAGLELACLDACGKATNRRLCELLGGPVRDNVEFAAYLFYRYAADHPKLLADRRIVDRRGRGKQALDDWGEVRTAKAMVQAAERFRKQWGFRVYKLKAGVLPVNVELETMEGLQDHFQGKNPFRIDPNGRWRVQTAIQAGKQLRRVNLEYYEDPVRGMEAMAQVRRATKLRMSTNSCVTRFEHVRDALKTQPIDVVLGDHHSFGGIPACQELGRLCRAVDWGMSQHSNNHAGVTMAAMIHLGAVTPHLTYASDTHYPWLPEGSDIIQGGKLPIQRGRMTPPKAAGVGVSLDRDQLARANETYRKCGMRDRDDANTMRMVEPGWKRRLF